MSRFPVLLISLLLLVSGCGQTQGTTSPAADNSGQATPATTQSPPLSPTTIESTHLEAAAPAGTPPPPAGLASGLYCRDLVAIDVPYLEAIGYWIAEGRPTRMDADANGIPCETVYPADDVTDFWGDSRAVAGNEATTPPPETTASAQPPTDTTDEPDADEPLPDLSTLGDLILPPLLVDQLAVSQSALTDANCGVDLNPSTGAQTTKRIELLEIFALCGHGWIPGGDVVLTVTGPGGIEVLSGAARVRMDGKFVVDYVPLPFHPTGSYNVTAIKGILSASGEYEVIEASVPRLRVFAVTAPGSDAFDPLTREGVSGDTFWFGLAGYVPGTARSVAIYRVDQGGSPQLYVNLGSITPNQSGLEVLEITSENSDPSGTYCVEIQSTVDPSGIDCERAGFVLG